MSKGVWCVQWVRLQHLGRLLHNRSIITLPVYNYVKVIERERKANPVRILLLIVMELDLTLHQIETCPTHLVIKTSLTLLLMKLNRTLLLKETISTLHIMVNDRTVLFLMQTCCTLFLIRTCPSLHLMKLDQTIHLLSPTGPSFWLSLIIHITLPLSASQRT